MGIDLAPIAISLARIVDLLSMGACDVHDARVTPTVNPLVFEVTVPLSAPVEHTLHAPLRKLVKQRCAEHRPRVYPGKVLFSANAVQITLYLERRVTPAWTAPDPEPEKS